MYAFFQPSRGMRGISQRSHHYQAGFVFVGSLLLCSRDPTYRLSGFITLASRALRRHGSSRRLKKCFCQSSFTPLHMVLFTCVFFFRAFDSGSSSSSSFATCVRRAASVDTLLRHISMRRKNFAHFSFGHFLRSSVFLFGAGGKRK